MKKTAVSSTFTIGTLFSGLALLFLLPDYFTTYPASLKTLIFFVIALLIVLFFVVTLFRRRHLYLNLSPLTTTLFSLATVIFFSVLFTNFAFPEKSFLSLAGYLIAFALIAIFSSTLFKLNNSQFVINTLLCLSNFAALLSLLVFLNLYFPVLPTSPLLALYSPLLNLNLLLIGLAAICAQFFKKSKFKAKQLAFLPLLTFGLIANLNLQFRALTPETPDFSQSVHTLLSQLSVNNQFQAKTLFFGDSARLYADIYAKHQTGVFDASSYTQAFGAPLTLFSLFGVIVLSIWFTLLTKTLLLSLKSSEPNNHLYFILLISFLVQLFTPIYPLVLLVQAILIAAATNKNKKTLINFNLSTIFDAKDDADKKVIQKDSSKKLALILALFLTFGVAFAALQLTRSYLGYFYHQISLGSSQSLTKFYENSLRAVKVAPFIDTFNRFAAIANLEFLVDSINNDPDQQQTETQQQYYQAAVAAAGKAISIEPHHAENYYVLAKIYSEIRPYLAATDHPKIDSDIVSTYAKAILAQPTNPDLYLSLGGFYQGQGSLDEALANYQTALSLNPNYLLTQFQLATLYEQKGDPDLALTTYENANSLLDPTAPNYLENSGQIKQKINSLQAQ